MPGAAKKTNTICAEQEIKVLSEISELVQGSPAEADSFEAILKLLGKIIDYRSASLYLLKGGAKKLDEICTVGRKVELIDFVNFEMGNGISAWVAKHRRPIVLNNLRKSKGGTHTKSFLSVPMMFGGDVLGVLNLAHDEPESYEKRDTEIVAIAASMIALLVERIEYKQALSSHARELESLKSELESARERAVETEKAPSEAATDSTLNQKITNPLAIIAGNAQFLMMTMKNTNPSVLKRLRAIDKEAANLSSITKGLLNLSSAPEESGCGANRE